MKTIKCTLLITLLFVSLVSVAQGIDMTGTWEAVSEDNYGDAEIKLIQTGETIVGECFYPKAGLKAKISATMVSQNQVVGVEKFQSGASSSFRWNVRSNSFQGQVSHDKKQVRANIKGNRKSSSIPVFSYQ